MDRKRCHRLSEDSFGGNGFRGFALGNLSKMEFGRFRNYMSAYSSINKKLSGCIGLCHLAAPKDKANKNMPYIEACR